MIKQTIITLALLATILGTVAETQDLGSIPTITLDDESIYTSEQAKITINQEGTEKAQELAIRIKGPETNLRDGSPEESVSFTPPTNGTYEITLYNKQTADLYDQKTLTVEEPPMIEALEDDAVTNRLITIPQEEYAPGSLIPITINYRSEDFTLRIITPENIYSHMGVPQRDIRFRAQEQGLHEVQLIAQEGVVERNTFTITNETSKNYENLPYTNIKNKIRNSKGEAIPNEQVRIRKDGMSVQSNIQENERYEVTITPQDPHVRGVRFEDLRPGDELDIGVEALAPRYNPAGRGTSVHAFAIDPSRADFTNGTITVEAPGTEIYKCTDYNFTTQECDGAHELILETKKGSLVEIPFDAIDPLYTFVDTTISCSCTETQDPAANSGTVSCQTYCPVTIDAPGSSADSGFLEEIQYVVDLTIGDGGTISNADHEGRFDHDDTYDNGNEQVIGTSTATASTTLTWAATGLASSGSDSFNSDNCDNWPTNCNNYYVYLSASFDFQAPGKSTREPDVTISLDTLNTTWNYTELGDLSVSIEEPGPSAMTNETPTQFEYHPIAATGSVDYCALYTNDTAWGVVNDTTSITNNATNNFVHEYSTDGVYVWNVYCEDSEDNEVFDSSNRTLTYDTTPPTVMLITPANESEETGATTTFEYNVTDNLAGVQSCSIYIDDTLEDTDNSITEATTQEFIIAKQNGIYDWRVECSDEAGNTGSSETREVTFNTTPTIWDGQWYETSTTDCASSGTCEIDLAQATDGTPNEKAISLPSQTSTSFFNATSPYFGGNGVYAPAGQTVIFRAEFSDNDGSGTLSWDLYAMRSDDSKDLICSQEQDISTGFIEATCNPASDTTFSGSDRLRVETTIENEHPAQTRSYTHDWDVTNSFIDMPDFYTIGSLTTTMLEPNASDSILTQEQFNMTCEATCQNGYCLDTNITAEYRDTDGGSWSPIGASGNLILANSTNPQGLGDLFADPTTSQNATFTIEGDAVSTNEVRCRTTTLFDDETSDPQTITVGDEQPPSVALITPADQAYTNTTTITFTYNVTDTGAVDQCDLYVDGVLNDTDNSPNNPGQDTFIVPGFTQGLHNWTVTCTDDGGRQGNATQTRDFTVDLTAPAITLHDPFDEETIPQNTVDFNWTVTDNNAANATCDLYINDTLEQASIQSTPGTPQNTVVEGFSVGDYNWLLECQDAAGNPTTSETRNFTITNTPPIVELISPQNNAHIPSSTLTLAYNASDNNEVLSCDLLFDGTLNQSNQTPISQAGTNNFTITGVSEGLHNWTVRCEDDLFNTSATPRNVTVDTTPPTITITSPIGAALSSPDVTFEFNYTDAISEQGYCTINYETGGVSSNISGINATSGSITTHEEPGLFDGVYDWNVTCADQAGNDDTSSVETFNISSEPSVTLEAPAANAYRNGAQVNFTFTPEDNDGLEACTLKLLSGPDVSNTTNQTPITNGVENGITLTNLGSGAHTWAVECVDDGPFTNSFETSQRFLFIDNQAPTLTLNHPVDTEVNTANVTFNWTADDDQDLTLSCDLYINGALNESSIASSAGEETTRSIDGFSNGLHNWSVTCADDASNLNATPTTNFTVEVPPTVSLRDPEDEQHLNFTQDFLFTYTPDANAALDYCDIYVDGGQVHTNNNPSVGVEQVIFVNFTPTDEGVHDWNVLCEDVDGLQGWAPENFTYTIDLTPPNITLHDPEPEETASWNNVTFNFTADDNLASTLSCDLVVDGFPEEQGVNLTPGIPYTTGVLLPDGGYEWYVSCDDQAGNPHTSEERNFTVIAPPTVTALEPENNTYFNVSDVTLTYLPEDGFPIAECNLSVNGEHNQSDSFIQTNENNTFELSGLEQGVYDWSVSCLDQDDNIGSSGEFTFSIDTTAPSVDLNDPADEAQFTTPDVTFNWTATDNLASSLTCDLIIDDVAQASNLTVQNATPYTQAITGFSDGLRLWNVSCVDDALWSATSTTRSFNVSVDPSVTLNEPLNDTWTSLSSIPFLFNVSDNDEISSCDLYFDEAPSTTNSTITNDDENTIVNNTLPEGTYDWTIACTDDGAYENVGFALENRTINIDRTPPTITLHEPTAGAETPNEVFFNYSIQEPLSPSAECEIILDGTNITSDTLVHNEHKTHIENLSLGTYYWNVTCIDYANNVGVSETRNFTIRVPDLTITQENITLSNPSPIEGETITIFANIFNIGDGNADNFTIRFYDGDPDASGTQVGSDVVVQGLLSGENITINESIPLGIGERNLFVLVDADDEVPESNETNNKANKTVSVGHYEIFSGTTNDELRLDDNSLAGIYSWSIENASGGNLFVADTQSDIDFSNLTALSRDTTGSYRADDFSELDVRLNSSDYQDSINNTYTNESTPLETRTYRVFGRDVEQVPVVESTNSSAFKTGILWDSSDGSAEYDGTQDIIFITTINESQQGGSGVYDYEFKVPATLRDYIPGGGTVTFYAEVR